MLAFPNLFPLAIRSVSHSLVSNSFLFFTRRVMWLKEQYLFSGATRPFSAALLAIASALSLPSIPIWLGTQRSIVLTPNSTSLVAWIIISFASDCPGPILSF